MKIIFWGTPHYAVESLNSLIEAGHQIVGVVTQPDKRRKRGSKLYPSPVKIRSLELGIPTFTPTKIKDDIDIQQNILDIDADIYVVVAFGQILPNTILTRPIYGCWNSHASLLPRWRGAAPIQRSLLAGDNETGIGIIYMEEGLDTGPIFIQEKIKINHLDNATQLAEKLSNLSAQLLVKALDKISTFNYQDHNQIIKALDLTSQCKLSNQVTYANMIKKEDYLINWNDNADNIIKQIMALHPNAYSYWKGKRIKIIEAIPYRSMTEELKSSFNISTSSFKSNKPSTIIAISSKLGILISTDDEPILILACQIEGKKVSFRNSLIQQVNPNVGDAFDNK